MSQQQVLERISYCKVLALDLEGTLIQDIKDPTPRPGLHEFLAICYDLFSRLVMFTTVPEPIFREIAKNLVKAKNAPTWFNYVEYTNWERPYKDLNYVSDATPEEIILVDDYEGYVHPHQKNQWIKIESFFESPNDRELQKLAEKFAARSMPPAPKRSKKPFPSP